MKPPFGKKRKRGLLESPWVVPVIAAAAFAGYFGADYVPALSGDAPPSFPAFQSLAPVSSPAPRVEQPRPAAVPRARMSFTRCSGSGGTCVIDGDTVRIGGETIRMMDIDAPETRNAQCAAERDRGNRATRRLIEILNSGSVTVVKRGSRDTDRYGRSLRVVMVNGQSAGDLLIAERLARKWSGQRRPWC